MCWPVQPRLPTPMTKTKTTLTCPHEYLRAKYGETLSTPNNLIVVGVYAANPEVIDRVMAAIDSGSEGRKRELQVTSVVKGDIIDGEKYTIRIEPCPPRCHTSVWIGTHEDAGYKSIPWTYEPHVVTEDEACRGWYPDTIMGRVSWDVETKGALFDRRVERAAAGLEVIVHSDEVPRYFTSKKDRKWRTSVGIEV